jgi:ATP-dependent DNA ligase
MEATKYFAEAISEAEKWTTDKEKHAAISGMNPDAQRLVFEALSPYRVFGVKKYDEPKRFAKTMSFQEDYTPFFALLDKLHDRELTGNAAREAVTSTLELYSQFTQTYLKRVLNKDLKCNCSEKTFNKIYPGLIPVFEVMLAAKMDEKYEWKLPALAEAKYDGTRLLAFVENGKVIYYSRSGKPSDFCNGIFDDELVRIEKEVGYPFVMDGEALASSFTETLNAKGSKGKKGSDEAKENLRFYCFDMLSMEEWLSQTCERDQMLRSMDIAGLLDDSFEKLIKSKYRFCHTREEIRAFYDEMLAEGYEGLIIKDPSAMYEWKRSKSWTKWKPVIDVDLKITGFYEGEKGKRTYGTLAGIYVEGYDENGNFIKSACGSGFNDIQRREIWDNREKYYGKMVMLEAQELCMAEGRTDEFSLRFPVYVKMRPDLDD